MQDNRHGAGGAEGRERNRQGLTPLHYSCQPRHAPQGLEATVTEWGAAGDQLQQLQLQGLWLTPAWGEGSGGAGCCLQRGLSHAKDKEGPQWQCLEHSLQKISSCSVRNKLNITCPRAGKVSCPSERREKSRTWRKTPSLTQGTREGETNTRHRRLLLVVYHVPSILPGALHGLWSMLACVLNCCLSMRGQKVREGTSFD